MATIQLGRKANLFKGSYLLGVQRLLGERLEVEPAEMWSTHVIGAPGFGKTTFLGGLVDQFLDAGEGVLIMDLKRDLAQAVATHTSHPDKLIYVAPHEAAKARHYWSFNPLDFDRDNRTLFQTYQEALPTILAYIGGYDPGVEAIIDTVLGEAVTLSLVDREACVLSVFQILFDERYRQRLLQKPSVFPPSWQYWTQDFAVKSDRDQRQEIASTTRRLRRMLRSKYLNFALNQPHTTLKLAEWLDQGQLVVCDFDQAGMGHNSARHFGNLLLGYLAFVAEHRPTGQTGRVWRLIVDEFHEFATDPFARMITQLRTYNVFPIVANQNWTQLSGVMKAAAEQCDIKVTLRLGSSDVASQRWSLTPEEAQDRANLEQYTAKIRLERGGPRGTPREERIRLLPWGGALAPEAATQRLAMANARQLELTQPESQLANFWDRFPRAGSLQEDDHARSRKTRRNPKVDQKAAARPDSSATRASQALPDGDDPTGAADPGGAGPVSVHDLIAGGPAAVPRPTDEQGPSAHRRRGTQRGQRGPPEPPQGPGLRDGDPQLPPRRRPEAGEI